MDVDESVRMNMLYDFYGGLLTDRQRGMFRMYYCEDMSLSEIADELSISRQGVHGALRKSAAALEGYESKLELVKKFRRAERAVLAAKDGIRTLEAERADDAALGGRLRGIRGILGGIDV
ncbi:MAG: YlxM family DNA-binding protein [Clostridiales Family XIII bacterium]|jgi:predicted DNA-binding protein YlxM (UPF0122 family)|nr:YlxM family DNA-binding protein [Clostridiales Family XIII bacterium]